MTTDIEWDREGEIITELKSVLQFMSNWMAIPLFLLFWISDIIYVPHLKWEFLAIRLLIVPVCLGVHFFSRKIDRLLNLKSLAMFYAVAMAAGINFMIWLIGDPLTFYYAGLGLVSIGTLGFIPFSKREFCLVSAGIYLPYYSIVLSRARSQADFNGIMIISFFIFSSTCLCFLVRFFQDGLKRREVEARQRLNHELANRQKIIRIKTEEAVKLNVLSSQFSPQIVDSIRSGSIKLELGGDRAEICSIFIDIVNSTERVVRIDKDQFGIVLNKFLDETAQILLKYDITIDKFLGDGILAFCNAPLRREDYVTRVVMAALEIREKIQAEQDYYQQFWLRSFDIRIGVSKGAANVGFYGNQKYYQSYTALGSAVNLASRLCATAEPNQIVIDQNVVEDLKGMFEIHSLGTKKLKGFEQEVIQTYEVKSLVQSHNFAPGLNECASCGLMLSLETNSKGQFVFMCKNCGSVLGVGPEDGMSLNSKPSKIA